MLQIRKRRRRKDQAATTVNEAKAQRTFDKVRLHYELGERASEDDADLLELAREYGYSERTARQSRLLFERVDKSTFAKLCSLRRKSEGQPLHWGYFHALASIDDPKKSAANRHAKILALARQAAEKDWKAEDLYVAMRANRRGRSIRPRKLKLHDTLRENLNRLADDARLWAMRCRQVIEKHFSQENDRPVKVGDKCLERLRTELAKVRSAEKEVSEVTTRLA